MKGFIVGLSTSEKTERHYFLHSKTYGYQEIDVNGWSEAFLKTERARLKDPDGHLVKPNPNQEEVAICAFMTILSKFNDGKVYSLRDQDDKTIRTAKSATYPKLTDSFSCPNN